MDPSVIAAVALMLIVTTVGNHFLPGRTERRRRSLAELPPARIKQAHGAVRLTGQIRRDAELLEAPLTHRACVGYELSIYEAMSSTAPGTPGFRRLIYVQDASSFLLVDESGTARIDTSGPFTLALVPDCKGVTEGSYPGEHATLAQLLESNGFKTTNWFGRWRPFHYEEAVLEEGALVEVGADSAEEIDPRGERSGLRSPPERLVLRGTEDRPLIIAKA